MKSNTSIAIVQRLAARRFGWLGAVVITAGLFVKVGVAQAQTDNTLAISEVGESATPVVTYNGTTVPLSPSSTLFKDNWTIVLPSTFALNSGGEVLLGEPENANQINDILVGTQPTTLTWLSDTAKPAGVGALSSSITIPGAGIFTLASGGTETFNLVLTDEPARTIPDTFSTSMLLGVALLGLFGASRIRAARS